MAGDGGGLGASGSTDGDCMFGRCDPTWPFRPGRACCGMVTVCRDVGSIAPQIRTRSSKDTGLTNLDFARNQIWCAIIALACKLLAWLQMLALDTSDGRRWEHKRLPLRLLSDPQPARPRRPHIHQCQL
jgi:hypothetical protein